MIAIGRRLLIFAIVGIAALAVVAVALVGLQRSVEGSVQADEDLANAQRRWDQVLTVEADRARAAVLDAVQFSGAGAQANGLDAATLDHLKQRGLLSLTFYDGLGQPSFNWSVDQHPPVVDDLRISQVDRARGSFQEVQISDSSAIVLLGGSFDPPTPGRAGFVASVNAGVVLADLTDQPGTTGFILDRNRRVRASKGPLTWNSTMTAGFVARRSDISEFPIETGTVELVVIPLRRTGLGLYGYVAVVRDVTLRSDLRDVIDSLSVWAVIAMCVILALSYQWLVGRTFDPLGTSIGAMSALAGGDTSIEVQGAGRPDEIGLMARSIQVFRDRIRRLRDTEERRLRQWSRQQEFIRVQMMQLADTLPEDGRNAFIEDLGRIEAVTGGSEGSEGSTRSLAVVFEVMAARVREQYRKLEDLVRELKSALATRTELFQLQQQVEIARRMQDTMLPSSFVQPPDVEVAGMLLPAEGFDGGFYDYVTLEDGRLAITIGQPGGGGLASGFISATARTSLHVLLLAGLPPAECLSRTAALLAREAAAVGYALAAGIIDPRERTLVWAAAGIEPPFLLRRLGDAVDVPFETPPMLTGEAGRGFADQQFGMPQRAALVVASPGMMAINAAGGTLTRERIGEILREADDISPAGLIDALRNGALARTGGRPGGKDRLCVAVRLG